MQEFQNELIKLLQYMYGHAGQFPVDVLYYSPPHIIVSLEENSSGSIGGVSPYHGLNREDLDVLSEPLRLLLVEVPVWNRVRIRKGRFDDVVDRCEDAVDPLVVVPDVITQLFHFFVKDLTSVTGKTPDPGKATQDGSEFIVELSSF